MPPRHERPVLFVLAGVNGAGKSSLGGAKLRARLHRHRRIHSVRPGLHGVVFVLAVVFVLFVVVVARGEKQSQNNLAHAPTL
ncbi:MAG: hypothetical protein DMF56_19660 [Acidobacteria bacterium]|nr:MAG: hypothetical protein DMF56_19660 [Acidobacteriota bacterium]